MPNPISGQGSHLWPASLIAQIRAMSNQTEKLAEFNEAMQEASADLLEPMPRFKDLLQLSRMADRNPPEALDKLNYTIIQSDEVWRAVAHALNRAMLLSEEPAEEREDALVAWAHIARQAWARNPKHAPDVLLAYATQQGIDPRPLIGMLFPQAPGTPAYRAAEPMFSPSAAPDGIGYIAAACRALNLPYDAPDPIGQLIAAVDQDLGRYRLSEHRDFVRAMLPHALNLHLRTPEQAEALTNLFSRSLIALQPGLAVALGQQAQLAHAQYGYELANYLGLPSAKPGLATMEELMWRLPEASDPAKVQSWRRAHTVSSQPHWEKASNEPLKPRGDLRNLPGLAAFDRPLIAPPLPNIVEPGSPVATGLGDDKGALIIGLEKKRPTKAHPTSPWMLTLRLYEGEHAITHTLPFASMLQAIDAGNGLRACLTPAEGERMDWNKVRTELDQIATAHLTRGPSK